MGKPAHNLVRLFDHRKLVAPNRDERRAEARDVGGLAHRIREETSRNVASETAKHDLLPHGRVALEPGDGDEIQIQDRELSELRDSRLEYDVRDVRVDADRKIVERDVEDVLPNVCRPA